MRTNSTQKAYDEAFLSCSTAVYFESQNNEGEALRSWKTALDQINYHNARRNPSSYRPASETEKALQDSLKQLELQCKERVDLLEALKRSREESKDAPLSAPGINVNAPSSAPPASTAVDGPSIWLGGGTIPPVDYTDLSRPPPLPYRPTLPSRKSSGNEPHKTNLLTQNASHSSLSPAPHGRNDSRTPSPEKKSRMLRTLRPGRDGKTSSAKLPSSLRSRPPEAAKAATQAWGYKPRPTSSRPNLGTTGSSTNLQPVSSASSSDRPSSALECENPTYSASHPAPQPNAPFYFRAGERSDFAAYAVPPSDNANRNDLPKPAIVRKDVPPSSSSRNSFESVPMKIGQATSTGLPTYRKEYPTPIPDRRLAASAAARSFADLDPNNPALSKDIVTDKSSTSSRPQLSPKNNRASRGKHTESPKTNAPERDEKSGVRTEVPIRRKKKPKEERIRAELPSTPTSDAEDIEPSEEESDEWKERTRQILKNLPRGVDEQAARQILNEIVIQGDEVHWDDVAGLEVAKSALKETVVYPFLRPDLFMGLREPARGMLLFGPPGTGKTMLARAVATESRSTFFAISASSLTSKFLGESEKLVRALFELAKMLAPSIIFVDEIDSLLSSRSSSGEHEATRRIKTEFLIQWSDLARAAAGKEQTEKDKERGDASRVLVLAATNLPWAIDEAARRRFVRRQYIPLPEDWVRKTQVKTLLSHQKHELSDEDLDRLVELTEGFSGSDITALAKDAAMGPLRSLGEKLLHMTMDEIPPIRFKDFQASLQTIKPSVSKEGLKVFEDWARQFGERGG